MLQLYKIILSSISNVKHLKRRALWISVYYGIHELSSFGFGSFSRGNHEVLIHTIKHSWIKEHEKNCFNKFLLFN